MLNLFTKKYTDEEIVKAFQSKGMRDKQDKIIKQIYKDNFQTVCKMVTSSDGTIEDAKDVMQESILAYIKNIEGFNYRGESALNTYLISIAKNLWKNEKRSRANSSKRSSSYTNRESNGEIAFEEDVVAKERKEIIENFLQKNLNNKCQEILKSYYLNERTIDELVDLHGFSSNQAARNAKYLCVKKLIKNINGDERQKSFLLKYFDYE